MDKELKRFSGKWVTVHNKKVIADGDSLKEVGSRATFSTFNSQIADYFGIDYKKGEKIFPIGISGHIKGFINEMTLIIQNTELICRCLFFR
ncbi:MAG: hypothetical protein B6D64_10335 [Bacteroidetes bacterium 4484_276]|nr:MAG: hypothetical protein B6D64_10335 [Bacteroidetes bacterium 4484_276]